MLTSETGGEADILTENPAMYPAWDLEGDHRARSTMKPLG